MTSFISRHVKVAPAMKFRRIFNRENLARLFLVVLGVFLALAACEYGLRFYLSATGSSKYYVWPPNMLKVFKPAPGTLPGVTEIATFRTNADGLRGDEMSSGPQYRILAIGGSTTECLLIDQGKAWPLALQSRLNAFGRREAWVGNAGKAGLSTREHYMHMKYLLPQFPGIDAVIILAGCNDLVRRLIEDEKYDPHFLDHYAEWEPRLIRGAFSETPYYPGKYRFRTGYYDETAIGSLYRKFQYVRSQRELHQDEQGGFYVQMREKRQSAVEIVDRLPDLGPALGEYRRNLNAIIDMAQARNIRILFVTQPYLWKSRMTTEEEKLLWIGWIESLKARRYYSARALAEGMDRYNRVLMAVCRERGLECIDLAGRLPKDTTIFVDDVHFNENGSLRAAEVIYGYLKAAKPFSP
jgi:GDSL-like Lipase/Acylhydrolase family